MRILLTGGSGDLGTELRKLRDYVAPGHDEFDITREDHVRFVMNYEPDLVVHAAAYTNVILPESSAWEARICHQVNVVGTSLLVKYVRCPMIYISSETVVNPYNYYARTKLEAEGEVEKLEKYTIVRTSFRRVPFEYPVAPTDMLTIGDELPVIARLVDELISDPPQGIVYVGTGVKTVYELARRSRPDVRPVTIAEIPFPLAPMDELRGCQNRLATDRT